MSPQEQTITIDSLFIGTGKDLFDERKEVNTTANGEARRVLVNAVVKTKKHTRQNVLL